MAGSVTGRSGSDTLSSVNIQADRRDRRRGFRNTAVLCAALLAACGSPADRGEEQRAASMDAGADVARFRAAYLTSLTFVGFRSPPSLVHVRFENRTDGDQLVLSYEGWLAGRDEWTPILSLRDTLPVPRAAWRVVPAGPSRIRVGDAAQIESLSLPLDSLTLRLDALDAISTWSSTTGQRETLRSAELSVGAFSEPGLLLQERRARILDAPRPDTVSQAFVLTDTVGNGIIILHPRALPDVPASVWAWLDGERVEWSDALVLPLAFPEGTPGRWSLEVADRDITVEIEGVGPVLDAASGSGAAYGVFPVRATLSFSDERRTMAGIRIEDVGP